MKTGLFCNYENHYQDARRAIFEQVALVKQAESLGFEEAWVSEHHFSESNLSPSMLLLLAHLAGITVNIHLGTAAVLLPFHNPIRVAEDIATLDYLCNGRLLFGVAKGWTISPAKSAFCDSHVRIPSPDARSDRPNSKAII